VATPIPGFAALNPGYAPTKYKCYSSTSSLIAERQLAAVEHTMRLEVQEVTDKTQHTAAHRRLVEKLLRRPARLWDEQ
jgi:hypothetical protein